MTNYINNRMSITCLHNSKRNQQGIALVMALIMLLVVTILGVSAVRMSSLDTQVAGNSILSMLVYQGAESAIGKSVTQENLVAPATNKNVASTITNPSLTGETVTKGAVLNSSAEVIYDKILKSPQINFVANSSEWQYQVFRFTGDSNINATGVSDQHIDGRAVPIPKP